MTFFMCLTHDELSSTEMHCKPCGRPSHWDHQQSRCAWGREAYPNCNHKTFSASHGNCLDWEIFTQPSWNPNDLVYHRVYSVFLLSSAHRGWDTSKRSWKNWGISELSADLLVRFKCLLSVLNVYCPSAVWKGIVQPGLPKLALKAELFERASILRIVMK